MSGSIAPPGYRSAGTYGVVMFTVVDGVAHSEDSTRHTTLADAVAAFFRWQPEPSVTNGGMVYDHNDRVILWCNWPAERKRPVWQVTDEVLEAVEHERGAVVAADIMLAAKGLYEMMDTTDG